MKAKSILKGVAICLGLAATIGVITNAYAATPSKNKYLSIYDKNNKQVFYQPVSDLNYVEVAEYQQPQVDPDEELAKKSYVVFRLGAVSFTMMKVEAGCDYTLKLSGSLTMTEATQHLPDFYFFSRYPVFNRVYQAAGYETSENSGYNTKFTVPEALEFVNSLNTQLATQLPKGYKLCIPTEQEWEFAAGGGKQSHNYQYSGTDDISKTLVAAASGEGYNVLGASGYILPNELGLYNMSSFLVELTKRGTKYIGKGAYKQMPADGQIITANLPDLSGICDRATLNEASDCTLRLCLKKVD